jgi:peroxiredoxin
VKTPTLILIGLTALVVVGPGCQGTDSTPLEIGDRAPVFDLPSVTGGVSRLSSDEFRGQIVVLNFWSTSCSVCLKETEDLTRIHEGRRAKVVSIALDSDPNDLRKLVRQKGIPYSVLLGNEEVFTKFDGSAIPYTLVLDRSGAVRRKAYGRIDSEELDRVIDKIDGSQVALRSEPSPTAPGSR